MKIVIKDNKKRVILIPFIIVFSILVFSYSFIPLVNLGERKDNFSNNANLLFVQNSFNDTEAPIIIFIQPSENATIIRQNFYIFIVNISDDNVPLYGNVTIQISNYTNFLFNGSMNYKGENQWTFNWDNISLYPNYNLYRIKVWARDSSPNENYSWSEYIYINISISNSPPILNVVLYLIAVSFIFALIIYYLNKKFRVILSEKSNNGDFS